MKTRNLWSVLVAGGVFLGTALAVNLAFASTPPPKAESAKKPATDADAPATTDQAGAPVDRKRAPSTGTAKRGEACKTSADCDQNSQPQSCVNSKCALDAPRPVPTT